MIRLRAQGLLAQALEHEIDHLDGVLFLDHLKRHEDLIRTEEEYGNVLAEAAIG